jgi:hypothetical protein
MIGNTMTGPRRRRRFSFFCSAIGLAALVLGVAGLVHSPTLRAATTEMIVVDRNSGLAISGFDPVAYFVNGAAVLGKPDFEASVAGVVWRFRNPGNRGAFVSNPDVYMPRFGGYDPLGIARGVAVAGDPRLWALSGERLYLFATPQDRDRFAQDAGGIVAEAERNWSSVQLTLSP